MRTNSQSHFRLTMREGRIRLTLEARRAGRDFSVLVTGGAAHVGAVALASPGQEAEILQLKGHRDGEIAAVVANFLAASLGCHVAVACGIHYDCITAEEIAAARRLARELAASLANRQSEGLSVFLYNSNKSICCQDSKISDTVSTASCHKRDTDNEVKRHAD